MTHDEFDDVLDAALASYSMVEPRAGLPGRIMARVHADGVVSRWRWWMLAALVCSMVIAIVMWRGRIHPGPVASVRPPMETAIPVPSDPTAQVVAVRPVS